MPDGGSVGDFRMMSWSRTSCFSVSSTGARRSLSSRMRQFNSEIAAPTIDSCRSVSSACSFLKHLRIAIANRSDAIAGKAAAAGAAKAACQVRLSSAATVCAPPSQCLSTRSCLFATRRLPLSSSSSRIPTPCTPLREYSDVSWSARSRSGAGTKYSASRRALAAGGCHESRRLRRSWRSKKRELETGRNPPTT